MNLAALWRLPVLFCCENNLYAMGTALGPVGVARPTSRCKAASYEMPAWPVDGMDVARGRATPRGGPSTAIRAGGGPRFLELPHLPVPRALDVRPGAATATRPRSSAWKERDPIDAARRPAARRGRPRRRRTWPRIEAEVAAEVDAAVAFAEAGTLRAGRGPDRASCTASEACRP